MLLGSTKNKVTPLCADYNNTHITQYLKMQWQSDNEYWSVYQIYSEKYFSSKVMQKTRQED